MWPFLKLWFWYMWFKLKPSVPYVWTPCYYSNVLHTTTEWQRKQHVKIFTYLWQHPFSIKIYVILVPANKYSICLSLPCCHKLFRHWVVVEKATPTHTALSFLFAWQQYGCISFWANTVATHVFIFYSRGFIIISPYNCIIPMFDKKNYFLFFRTTNHRLSAIPSNINCNYNPIILTLPKALQNQGNEYFDSFNTLSSKQKL